MRIAFLSPFYPFRGGIAQFSDSLYISLSENAEVKAFTFTRQYPKPLFPGKTQFVSESDTNRNIPVTRLLDSINPLTYYRTAKEIIKFNPDVVLMSYWMPFFAPSFGKVAGLLRKNGIKVILLLHNVIAHEKRFGDEALTKYFFNRCDGFVLLNKASEKDLLSIVPNAKYIIHPHPLYDHYGSKIDKLTARNFLGVPADKKTVLFFGFIRDYKGLDILIDSFKELDDSYHLIIAGEVYGDFKKYEEQISRLGLAGRISLHVKYIPETEIPLYFSASDVCVLPYRTATQSGIIGMSYHFDLPVIVTNTGGLAEMVEENTTGLIVQKVDSAEIAAALKKYFSEDMKQEFIPNILNYKSAHSWGNLSESIINLVKNTV
ncbi:MAG: glycosyltransferase [Ignavibacteria bacterium]|nr:glycosyltransferase [Ignavibacteria bacterium]